MDWRDNCKDEFIVMFTSYRDLNNLLSSQDFLQLAFCDLNSAKEFARKSSKDAKKGIIPLELNMTARTTGIIIYGAPLIFSENSKYAQMNCFHNEKISVRADTIKRHQASIRKAKKERINSSTLNIIKEAE